MGLVRCRGVFSVGGPGGCRAGPLNHQRGGALGTPGGKADGDPQRLPALCGFDLDGAEPVEDAAGHHLPARAVGSGQQDRQLAMVGDADPVEVAQLPVEGAGDVGERLLAQLGAVLTGDLVEVLDDDQQQAEGCAVALGAADLLAQALGELRCVGPVGRSTCRRRGTRGGFRGGHALTVEV